MTERMTERAAGSHVEAGDSPEVGIPNSDPRPALLGDNWVLTRVLLLNRIPKSDVISLLQKGDLDNDTVWSLLEMDRLYCLPSFVQYVKTSLPLCLAVLDFVNPGGTSKQARTRTKTA